MAVAEAYPDLKASANFQTLQKDLADLEDQIQLARRYYNGAVRNFNVSVQQFPSNLIANIGRLHRGAVLPARQRRRPQRAESLVQLMKTGDLRAAARAPRASGGGAGYADERSGPQGVRHRHADRVSRRSQRHKRAHHQLRQRHHGRAQRHADGHRDDHGLRRQRADQPRHLSRLSRRATLDKTRRQRPCPLRRHQRHARRAQRTLYDRRDQQRRASQDRRQGRHHRSGPAHLHADLHDGAPDRLLRQL